MQKRKSVRLVTTHFIVDIYILSQMFQITVKLFTTNRTHFLDSVCSAGWFKNSSCLPRSMFQRNCCPLQQLSLFNIYVPQPSNISGRAIKKIRKLQISHLISDISTITETLTINHTLHCFSTNVTSLKSLRQRKLLDQSALAY